MATITRPRIGPADHGRRMTLDEFVDAEFEEGRIYELARGVVQVTEVPDVSHAQIVDRIGDLFAYYKQDHPGIIVLKSGGGGGRRPPPGGRSGRRPGPAKYPTPPPPPRPPP